MISAVQTYEKIKPVNLRRTLTTPLTLIYMKSPTYQPGAKRRTRGRPKKQNCFQVSNLQVREKAPYEVWSDQTGTRPSTTVQSNASKSSANLGTETFISPEQVGKVVEMHTQNSPNDKQPHISSKSQRTVNLNQSPSLANRQTVPQQADKVLSYGYSYQDRTLVDHRVEAADKHRAHVVAADSRVDPGDGTLGATQDVSSYAKQGGKILVVTPNSLTVPQDPKTQTGTAGREQNQALVVGPSKAADSEEVVDLTLSSPEDEAECFFKSSMEAHQLSKFNSNASDVATSAHSKKSTYTLKTTKSLTEKHSSKTADDSNPVVTQQTGNVGAREMTRNVTPVNPTKTPANAHQLKPTTMSYTPPAGNSNSRFDRTQNKPIPQVSTAVNSTSSISQPSTLSVQSATQGLASATMTGARSLPLVVNMKVDKPAGACVTLAQINALKKIKAMTVGQLLDLYKKSKTDNSQSSPNATSYQPPKVSEIDRTKTIGDLIKELRDKKERAMSQQKLTSQTVNESCKSATEVQRMDTNRALIKPPNVCQDPNRAENLYHQDKSMSQSCPATPDNSSTCVQYTDAAEPVSSLNKQSPTRIDTTQHQLNSTTPSHQNRSLSSNPVLSWNASETVGNLVQQYKKDKQENRPSTNCTNDQNRSETVAKSPVSKDLINVPVPVELFDETRPRHVPLPVSLLDDINSAKSASSSADLNEVPVSFNQSVKTLLMNHVKKKSSGNKTQKAVRQNKKKIGNTAKNDVKSALLSHVVSYRTILLVCVVNLSEIQFMQCILLFATIPVSFFSNQGKLGLITQKSEILFSLISHFLAWNYISSG